MGWGVVAASRLIPIRVGDIEIEVETVPLTGTEATSGRAARAAGSVVEAFGRAQDAIVEVPHPRLRHHHQVNNRLGADGRSIG